MPDEKDIKINIHTDATGDGVKKTSDELDQLTDSQGRTVESSESLRTKIDSIDNISEEARAGLHGLVDQMDELKERTAAAAAGSNGLAKSEKKVGDEGKKAARSLDKINTELAEAKRRLQQAAVGSADFAKRQKQVTALTREQQAVMRRGAGGTRNFGLAALEASRAVEDMQYGVRGVINNIPQMVLMMGGSAGLTAVISLVAVGLSQLGTAFAKANEEIEFNAEEIEGAEERKREALKKSERAIQVYQDSLEESGRKAKREREELDLNTKAAIANAEAKLKLVDSRIKNAILEVEGDVTLSSDEKERRIFSLRQRYSKEAREVEEKNIERQLENNLAHRRRNFEEELEMIDLLAEADRKRAEAKQAADDLAVAKSGLNVAEQALEAAAKKADQRPKGFGIGEKDFDDFKDEGDQQIQAYLDHLNNHVRPKLNRHQKVVLDFYINGIVDAFNEVEKSQERVLDLEGKEKELREASEAASERGKKRLSELDDEHAKLVRNNKDLERRLELTRQLNRDEQFRETEGRRQKQEGAIDEVRKSSGGKAKGLFRQLGGHTDEDSELAGSSREDKEFNRKRVDDMQSRIAAILEDGQISEAEYLPFIQAVEQMKQAVSGTNDKAINIINALLEVAKGQEKRIDDIGREVQRLGSAVRAQGIGR